MNSIQKPCSWQLPPIDAIKVNVDEVAKSDSAGCGDMLRNAAGIRTYSMTRRNPELSQSGSQPQTSLMSLSPGEANGAVDDGNLISIGMGSSLKKTHRQQRGMVCREMEQKILHSQVTFSSGLLRDGRLVGIETGILIGRHHRILFFSEQNTSKKLQTENHGRERTLPKFGEWDLNNPAAAERFTVIFEKASDQKKAAKTAGSMPLRSRYENTNSNKKSEKKKWLCCISS
ncbi:hypothetical protein V6N11_076482 [Hibiscus sabdariffa]|uniref:RIN4 pathogenic type III effector avirulence factor Avr cleavage site domain-containing protein n=1 Tax=Hibiscus sabdariffa TaxID=183260 RepID=A0ABR2Q6X2_9ROSI